jgi:hypothetical protein
MSDLVGARTPVSLHEMILEIKREVQMRENLYGRWIASNRITPMQAERRIFIMQEIARKLEAEYDGGQAAR